MFDLITTGHRRAPHRDTAPLMLSLSLHFVAIVMIVVPLMYVTDSIPQVPGIMAFVAAAPAPPPPPPPPPPPQVERGKATTQPVTPPSAPTNDFVAIEVPTTMEPEDVGTGSELGVPGDVEGGVPGGVPGGVVGGLIANVPPPPPPPESPVPKGPVRVGGEIKQPALLSRVGPEYPVIAVRARIEGLVVLEAVVGPEGRVESVKILRSVPLLDRAAIDAVRQWRYAPLLLNGQPARFIVTVTVSFQLPPAARHMVSQQPVTTA